MSTYTPHLTKHEGFTPDDREIIQQHAAIHNLTHVRTKTGETRRIRLPLNEKSIPLNDASTTKTRVNYSSVESFGIINEQPETSRLAQAVKSLNDSGVTVSVDLIPGVDRDGSSVGVDAFVSEVMKRSEHFPSGVVNVPEIIVMVLLIKLLA